jgi:RHS repeat-associated protein
MTYTYDALNRLASAKDNRIAAQGGPSTPTTYSYDPVGNLLNYTYPNTVQTANVFDPLNRLTQTCSATSSPACSASSKLASYAYTLGNAGNRTNVLELNSRNVAYGYDNDYRLQSEAVTADPGGKNGIVNYIYDFVGNRASMTSTLNAVPGGSFFYDNNDQLSTDTYDANGNTISSTGIANTYDFENRMLTHGSVALVYDGDGNRVSETVGGTATKFLVDDHNPTGLPQVLDEIASGSVTRTYAYGLQRISENQLVSSTWTPSFYGYDGHGNVRFLASTAGASTDSYDYDAFGMPIRTSGTTSNQFLYSGERADSSIGLYDLRARYYNQATGRFSTRDPIEGRFCCGLSWNPYVYTKDDAINSTDPTGQEALAEYIETVKIVAGNEFTPLQELGDCINNAYLSEANIFRALVLPELDGSRADESKLVVRNVGRCLVKASLPAIPCSFTLPWESTPKNSFFNPIIINYRDAQGFGIVCRFNDLKDIWDQIGPKKPDLCDIGRGACYVPPPFPAPLPCQDPRSSCKPRPPIWFNPLKGWPKVLEEESRNFNPISYANTKELALLARERSANRRTVRDLSRRELNANLWVLYFKSGASLQHGKG